MYNYWLSYILIIATVLISGSLVLILKKQNKTVVKYLLAFSGAFLLGLSFNSLLPEVFEAPNIKLAVGFIFAGFVVQLLLDILTRGVEHGHDHECEKKHNHIEKLGTSAIGLMFGLCIHSFFEGMPIVDATDEHIAESLTAGIILHNIPISIVLSSLFLTSGYSPRKIFVLLMIFAVMSPIGSLVSYLSGYYFNNFAANNIYYIIAFVVGIFLHVSTSVLYETGENHIYNIRKLATVVLGLALSFLISHH